MHVKPSTMAMAPFPLVGRPAASFRRNLAGGAILLLVVLADVLSVGLGAWVATQHTVSFGSRELLAFLAIYGIAALCLGLQFRSKTWVRDRATLIIALVVGSTATEGVVELQEMTDAVVWFFTTFLTVLLFEKATRHIRRKSIACLRPMRSIAFVGNSPSAARMLAQLQREGEGSVDLVGFFDDRNARGGPLSGVIPHIGNVDDVVGYLQENSLSEVFIALPWSASQRMAQLLERLRFLPLTVRLIPDHLPPTIVATDRTKVDDVIMPTLMVPPFSSVGGLIKRIVDLSISCVLIVPLAPLFLVVAALIKLDSSGPVFFRQSRSGQFGRCFMIYKFRTLHSKQQDTAAETLVTHGDSRVTSVGRILRKYSIDELPQIFNVLFGHMSLVGPRPHAPRAKANGRIYSEVLPDYALRYRVKPGMTGWAQVNGWRGNTDTEDQLRRRVEFDFDYIGKWSIWRDFGILARTVPSMLMPPTNNA